jgi:hypothetical protein
MKYYDYRVISHVGQGLTPERLQGSVHSYHLQVEINAGRIQNGRNLLVWQEQKFANVIAETYITSYYVSGNSKLEFS